jgi:PGF-CTERM protein
VNNPSETTPGLNEETGAEEISYINVEESIDDDDIDTVDFEFSVSRDRLARSDLSADQVSLYRYNGQQWEEYDATVASEGDDRITYTASVPGLSVFAIGSSSEQVTATPEPDTDTPEPDTATPEPDTDTPERDTPTSTPTTTPTSTPGFGVGIALTALLAAAFLFRRRDTE